MISASKEQKINLKSLSQEFIISCKASGLSDGTISFYQFNLNLFQKFCEEQKILYIEDITPAHANSYMLWLTERGHNEGGKHGAFRALRALVNYFIRTYEPTDYHNPLKKIRSPKNSRVVLDPVDFNVVKALLSTCIPNTYLGDRDAAIILTLLDTGVRANELVSAKIGDLDIVTSRLLIRHGKGDKQRSVFVGQHCKKAIRKYLRHRQDAKPEEPLFATTTVNKLSYWGLRDMVYDRAERAGVAAPPLHSFRRAFALACLRNGMDIYSLQHLMGHADLQVLRHYLKQTDEDLRTAHMTASPVDRMK